MPSISSFLKVKIPKGKLMEIDGVSLIGKLSATDAKASIKNNSLEIKWDVINKEGKAKIWIATTNNFKTGGHDDYKLVAEVPVAGGKAIVDTKQTSSGFYKIVIEMPYNILNRWIQVKQ
jgi:hypothetical protein